jgi:hypothetical protein
VELVFTPRHREHMNWAMRDGAHLFRYIRKELPRLRSDPRGYEVWRAIQDDIDDERRRVP